MNYPELKLRKGSERSLINGHPWVYSGALDQSPDGIPPGDVVDVVDHRERFIGRGSYNPHSGIRIRMLTSVRERPIDRNFFRQSIKQAYQLRQQSSLPGHTTAYRIVHGESDNLPGLVVDRG